MLGTLLEKLGTLLPKNFIIAYFFPVLFFASANFLMLYWVSVSFREWCKQYFALDAGKQALYGFPLLIAIALIAYIFSTLNLFLRKILEGEYFNYLPPRIKDSMMEAQQRRIDDWENKLSMYRRRRRELRRLRNKVMVKLESALGEGEKSKAACTYSKLDPASVTIKGLKSRRDRHKLIKIEDLSDAFDLVEQELRKCHADNMDPNLPDIANKRLLDADRKILDRIMQDTLKEADNDYIASFNQREFNSSSYKVAPTAMGNIAESVRGYARSRYSINLDPFWSRLQKIVQGDEKFYATLLDAKTQLDFLISLFWLTVIFTALWVSVLLVMRTSIMAFLIVGMAGPLLSWLWYRVALQNYLAFADILRTSVDLYRLKLLQALHIRLPAGNEHERRLWEDLGQIIGYGDDAVRISYQHAQE